MYLLHFFHFIAVPARRRPAHRAQNRRQKHVCFCVFLGEQIICKPHCRSVKAAFFQKERQNHLFAGIDASPLVKRETQHKTYTFHPKRERDGKASMVLLAGAICGVRNDSCSRTHKYARTSHGMASESAGTAGRDAAGSVAGAGAESSSSGRAGPAGVICASGGARWGGAASAVVPAHWREPLVMQVQDLAEVRRQRFRGDGGG